MKITVTERGQQLIKTLGEQAKQDEYLNQVNAAQSTKNYRTLKESLSLPTISIDVKTPIIKISEPFKSKYDSPTKLNSIVTLASNIHTKHMNGKRNKNILGLAVHSDIYLEKKIEMKYNKIKEKYNFQKEKAEQIINNIRKKIDGRASVIKEFDEEIQPPMQYEDSLYQTNYLNRKAKRIELIHQLKYRYSSKMPHGSHHYQSTKFDQLKSHIQEEEDNAQL